MYAILLNIKIVHFCYFQITFPFVSMSRPKNVLYPVPRNFVVGFFSNIIGLPEKCFGNNKNVLFLNLNDKIIEQEMNKMGIYTHVIFRPRNTMFLLSNT